MPRAGSSSNDVEHAVLALLGKHPAGVSNDVLGAELGHIDAQARVEAINALLRGGRVSLFQSAQGALLYRLAAPADTKTKALGAEELLVYQVIKQAGNTGVWTRDMKVRTNLGQPQVSKILKTLEGRGLIKAVKNVNNPSRKLYMLAELEPSREITGGAWYTNQELDCEFIEVLRNTCLRLIERHENPHASLADVAAFINGRGVSRVELSHDEIRTLLDTLVADGKVEVLAPPEGAPADAPDRYRVAVLRVPETTPLTAVPCGVCPVIDQCREGGQISPQTCVYYGGWLDF